MEDKQVFNANFTGFSFTYGLLLPEKRTVNVKVMLNGELYVFRLLIVRHAPSPEELEAIETVVLAKGILELAKARAWGGALVGAFLPIPIYVILARRLRRQEVKHLA